MPSLARKLLSGITRDSYVRGFSLLTGGTAVTQVILLVLAPVLTRLYSPAEYGVNAVFISLLTICGVLATMRLQVPVAMAHDSRERVALSRLGVASSVAVGCVLALLVALFGNEIRGMIDVESGTVLWALPIGTLLLGTYQVLCQNLLGLKEYGRIARVGIIQVSFQGMAQIALSFAGVGALGLIGGTLSAYVVGSVYVLRVLSKAERSPHLRLRDYRDVLRKHIDFPKYALPAELASIGSYSAIPLAMTALFGSAATGLYSLANRLIGIPIQLFGESLRQVYVREASAEFHAQGSVSRSFARTSRMLVAIGLPVAAALYLVAPLFFKVVFGPAWGDAGIYVRMMTPFLLARFLVEPLITTVNVVGKQRAGLWIQVALLLGVLAVAFRQSALPSGTPQAFLGVLSLVFALTSTVVYIGLYVYVRALRGGHVADQLQ